MRSRHRDKLFPYSCLANQTTFRLNATNTSEQDTVLWLIEIDKPFSLEASHGFADIAANKLVELHPGGVAGRAGAGTITF
jgi:hypothetical protein